MFTVEMGFCGLPPFPQRARKGWGTRISVNARIENALAFQLFYIKPEADEEEGDGDEADAETDAAVIALDHRVVAGFTVRRGDLHADLNVLIDEVSLEAVDCYAGLGECVACLILIEAGLTDFHAGSLGATERLVSAVDRLIELGEVVEDVGTGAIAMIVGRVAAHAHASGAGTKHGIGRLVNTVVAVADDAAGKTLIRKGLAVGALLVHLGLEDVAVCADVLNLVYAGRNSAVVSVASGAGGRAEVAANREGLVVRLGLEDVAVCADVLNLVYAGRNSAVVSVASGAGGRAEVAANRERLVVNAGVVVGELIGGNAVGLHV